MRRSGRLLKGMLFSVLFIATSTYSFSNESTEYIPAQEYFDIAIAEINSAKSSIQVFMYLISAYPDQSNSQPNQLISALVQARDRGVEVKIILDQTLDFGSEVREADVYQNKNQNAYEYLKRNGISVFFDEADTFTHAKAIVIDGETVILGSTNWSKAALTQNHEANALIRSKDFAQSLLSDMASIKIQEYIPAVVTPTVNIPKEFLVKDKLLGEMVSQADERTFDTYLYLLSQYNGNTERKLTLDYDNLAKSLGINNMTKEDYRRQINKVLDKIQDKYKLIKFKSPARNQNAELTLLESKGEEAFSLPTSYWKYGWNRSLSFPSKVMYLICLSYTSPSSPDFFMSRETLSNKHHISESFITDGTRELRRLNLLDIKYGELEGKSYDQRQANVYTPLPLYDPQDLQKDLRNLEAKHGKDKVERAKQVATIVFEENNLKAVQALIDLEGRYGETVISEAASKLAEKNPDNPKRTIGYLINTSEGIAKDKS